MRQQNKLSDNCEKALLKYNNSSREPLDVQDKLFDMYRSLRDELEDITYKIEMILNQQL